MIKFVEKYFNKEKGQELSEKYLELLVFEKQIEEEKYYT